MKYKIFIIIPAFLVMLLGSCTEQVSVSPDVKTTVEGYFPIHPGNRWEYKLLYYKYEQNSQDSTELIIRVTGEATFGGLQYYIFEHNWQYKSIRDTAYYRLSPEGNVYAYIDGKDRLFIALNDNAVTSKDSLDSYHDISNKNTRLKTSVGDFSNVYVTKSSNSWSKSSTVLYLAKGIGIVRIEYYDGNVLELTKAYVNNKAVPL